MNCTRFYIFIAAVSLALCAPAFVARAATISFDPQETTVGMSSTFLVGVTIDADTPVSALHAVIDVPETMDIVDVSDGNSVINLWVERPHVAGHQLIFDGIIPGGFSGLKGKLVTLTVKANKTGKHDFILDPSSKMYSSSPDAQEQSIATKPLELLVEGSKDNIANPLPDTAAPEPFTPTLVDIPGENGNEWAVSFATQDKGSGIASYQVAETRKRVSLAQTSSLEALDWNTAESPYVLNDQKLASYIYVKAADENGNVRFERLAPRNPEPWYAGFGGYILMFIVLAILAYAFKRYIRIELRRKDV